MDSPILLTPENSTIDPPKYQINFSIITIANLVASGLNLLIGMYLVRQFPPEIYGQLTYLLVRFGFFRLLATLGMGSILTLNVARIIPTRDLDTLNRYYYSFLTLRMFIACALMAGTLLLFIRAESFSYLIMAMFILPVTLSDFNLAVLQGDIHTFPIVVTVLAQPISYSVMAFAFVTKAQSLSAVYLALLLSYVFSFILGMLFVMMKGIRRPRIKWIDLGLTKSLSVVLGSSFLFAIAQYVFSIITVYILGSQGRFAASAQLGILLSLIMLPASLLQIPIASVFQPYFARLYSPIDPSKAADFLSDFLLFVFRLTIIATLVCASFSQAIIHFFYGDQYISSAPYLIVLSPIMVLFSIEFLLIVVLLALNKPALVFPGLISQLLIVVLLTYITTSMWNANLLILSFTQSFSLVIGTVLLLWAVNKVIRFQLRPVEYLITTGLSIAVVSIARLIVAWTNGNLFWEIVGASLAFVMYLALMSKKIFGISVGEFLSLRRCKRFSSPGST